MGRAAQAVSISRFQRDLDMNITIEHLVEIFAWSCNLFRIHDAAAAAGIVRRPRESGADDETFFASM